MRKNRILILLIFFIVLLTFGYSILKFTFNYYSGYLSKSEHVHANILIVEGWLPEYAVELAYKEFQRNGYDYIITTGLKENDDYYRLSMNGYLIFYLKNKAYLNTESGPHSIKISAYSELEGENCAHFNVFVNDSLINDFLADKKKQEYLIPWEKEGIKIDSIMVQFDNDRVGDYGDRNLYIKEIIIDQKIVIPFLNNSVYDISKLDGIRRILNNYNSDADLARNSFLSMGVDSSRIIAIAGRKVTVNRTLTSALAVRDWLKTSNLKVEGINIVSAGTHARRTWMAYTKVLNKAYDIGIISLPDYENNYSRKSRLKKTLRETAAIVYYWVILLPY